MEDAIQYTVKKNHRAKRVTLRITAMNGLVLTVPARFNHKHIPQILNEHKAWILASLLEVQKAAEKQAGTLPSQITLTALNETWSVQYLHRERGGIRMERPHNKQLVIYGDATNTRACQHILTAWIRKKARILLTQCLQTNSIAAGLNYQRFQLRGQKSRWGSCNAQQCISLNFKLIFLPMPLVRHVILHELAHTIHLNHSPHFWRLLAALDPDWQENRIMLRHQTKKNLVPTWVA